MALVLIAEDEPNILESLAFLMERAGYEVESVSDAAGAIAATRRLSPAVLILDIMLREGDGFEVLKAVRETPTLAGTKVLVLTAKGQERDRRTALDLGADAFVTKPFSNRDLVDQVGALAAGGPSAAAALARGGSPP